MRKIIISIICVLITCYAYLPNRDIFKGLNCDRTIYSESKSSNAVITMLTEKDYVRSINNIKNVTGQSITLLNDDTTANKIIERYGFRQVFVEKGDGFCSRYYYSNRIKTYVYIKGKKINLQINERGEYLTMGYPIIFGGF